MSVFWVSVSYELWVNVPAAIFFGTVDWNSLFDKKKNIYVDVADN